MTHALYAGIDVGASATKVALLDSDGKLNGHAIVPSGMDFVNASQTALDTALAQAGASMDDLVYRVSCGYGRKNVVQANETRTEIACHAQGAYDAIKEKMSVIDIGGQDNKVIKVNADGARTSFKMNRKCAAGTGAFLEEIATRIGVDMSEMEKLARQSTESVELGSFCTVFAATEILGLVRKGVKIPDIVKGAFKSVVKRVVEMDVFDDTIVATGGVVAHNPMVLELLAEFTKAKVLTPPHPQLTGAIGAALYAVKAA
jgi:(R)-2-hydroxyacyl-CoA dehydratese activating ATPase